MREIGCLMRGKGGTSHMAQLVRREARIRGIIKWEIRFRDGISWVVYYGTMVGGGISGLCGFQAWICKS